MKTRMLQCARRAVTTLVAAAALSGCFLQVLTGAAFLAEPGGDLITTVRTDSTTATCVDETDVSGVVTVECTYVLPTDDGFIEFTSTAELVSEFGLLGLVIDPLLAQIPAGATDISGTWNDGAGNSGSLDVQAGFRSIPIDVRRHLFAEPGTQFVLADLPGGLPVDGVDYQFELSFATAGDGGPVSLKPLLTMKIDSGTGQVYYPPLLPCVDDMASVEAIAIPVSATPQPLAATAPPVVCSNEFYPLLGFGVFPCDFNGDDVVDREDIARQASVRNSPALPGDRLDRDRDGDIDIFDVRLCTQECSLANCQTPPRRAIIPTRPRAPAHGAEVGR